MGLSEWKENTQYHGKAVKLTSQCLDL